MSREPGTTCGIGPYTWWPLEPGEEPPGEGDFLVTRTGTSYRIDSARTVGADRPGATARRFMFRCTRLERGAVQLGEPGVYSLAWDPR